MGDVVNNTQRSERDAKWILPSIDVVEDAASITLYADMPGVSKDQLSVHVEADSLTIQGDVSLNLVQGMEARYVEVPIPRYKRTFTLGKELAPDKMSAELQQGVLKLHIPKAEHAKPRKIEVRTA